MRGIHQIRMFAAVLRRLCKVTAGQRQISIPLSLHQGPVSSDVSPPSLAGVTSFHNRSDVSLQLCATFFFKHLHGDCITLPFLGIILSTAEQHKQSQKKTSTAGICNLSDKWNTWFSGYISGGVAGTFLSKRQPRISSFTLLKMDPQCLVIIWCVTQKWI